MKSSSLFQISRILSLLCLFWIHFEVKAQEILITENFDNPGLPAGWIEQWEGNAYPGLWNIEPGNNAGGLPGELVCQTGTGNGITRIILPVIDGSAMNSLTLNWKQLYLDGGPGLMVKIQVSFDGTTWYDNGWIHFSGNGDLGPEQNSVALNMFQAPDVYLAFVVEGDLSAFNGWFIDEVSLTATYNYLLCPTLITPGDLNTDIGLLSQLNWAYTPDAIGYYLSFGSDNPPSNIVDLADVGYIDSWSTPLLSPATTFYWTIKPYNTGYLSPQCPVQSFQTIHPQSIPFQNNFEESTFPSGWSQQNFQPAPLWSIGTSDYAGGMPNEMLMTWVADSGTTRLILPPINSSGLSQLNIQFRHLFADYDYGLTARIQTSTDMINWNDLSWSFSSGSGNIGPELITIPCNQDLGSVTYIAFCMTGNHYNFYYWAIDEIQIDTTSLTPALCTEPWFPVSGSTGISAATGFCWHSVPGIGQYQVFAGTDNPPSNILNGTFINDTLYIPPGGFPPNTEVFWKVIPTDSSSSQGECPVWSFTTAGVNSTFPYLETFDASTILPSGWTSTGEEHWIISSQATFGPWFDHTTGNGKFVMVDDSYPHSTTPTMLLSPSFDISTLEHPVLIFWLQSGNSLSSFSESELHIDLLSNGQWIEDIRPSLKYFSQWKKVIVDLNPYKNSPEIKIRFRALEDTQYEDADIAIDDFVIKDSVMVMPCTQLFWPADSSIVNGTNHIIFTWKKEFYTSGYLFSLGSDNPPSNLFNFDSLGHALMKTTDVPQSNTTYYWRISTYNSYDTSECPIRSFMVAPVGSVIEGHVYYGISGNIALQNTSVELWNAGQIVQSTQTGTDGSFSFSQVPDGTYTIKVTSTTNWGGGNAVDALLAMKHFVSMDPLTGLRLATSDVDGSGFTNSADALAIMKRFVSMQNSFPAGDWTFEEPVITVSSGNPSILVIRGLCKGDIDGSYGPSINP